MTEADSAQIDANCVVDIDRSLEIATSMSGFTVTANGSGTIGGEGCELAGSTCSESTSFTAVRCSECFSCGD